MKTTARSQQSRCHLFSDFLFIVPEHQDVGAVLYLNAKGQNKRMHLIGAGGEAAAGMPG